MLLWQRSYRCIARKFSTLSKRVQTLSKRVQTLSKRVQTLSKRVRTLSKRVRTLSKRVRTFSKNDDSGKFLRVIMTMDLKTIKINKNAQFLEILQIESSPAKKENS
jgi:uncharacterized protein YoxC